jgi:hypothetical protein
MVATSWSMRSRSPRRCRTRRRRDSLSLAIGAPSPVVAVVVSVDILSVSMMSHCRNDCQVLSHGHRQVIENNEIKNNKGGMDGRGGSRTRNRSPHTRTTRDTSTITTSTIDGTMSYGVVGRVRASCAPLPRVRSRECRRAAGPPGAKTRDRDKGLGDAGDVGAAGHGRKCVNRDTCLGVDKVCQGRHGCPLSYPSTIMCPFYHTCTYMAIYLSTST